MKRIILLLISFVPVISFAQMWSATSALSTSGGGYLIAADHVMSTVYAVGNNQEFVFSKDKGQTWQKQSVTKPADFAVIKGVGDRLYASFKVNTYDYLIGYSTDDGKSWKLDTVGLPVNITKTGKKSLNIRDMRDDYILAFDATSAYVKKTTETVWTKTTIDPIVTTDVTTQNGVWYAIGVQKILRSDDNGKSWSAIETIGLPNNFQGNVITSNQRNRLYISSAPADGGTDIYYSEDDGKSWTKTNSGQIYTHQYPFVGKMYAVESYVFAAINPKFADNKNPPPFIMSTSSDSVSFSAGDTSGFLRGQTNTALPFFFHIEDKLFTMFWELYESKPGFVGDEPSSVIDIKKSTINVYPNPTQSIITVKVDKHTKWNLTDLQGRSVISGQASEEFEVDLTTLMSGIYFLQMSSGSLQIMKE